MCYILATNDVTLILSLKTPTFPFRTLSVISKNMWASRPSVKVLSYKPRMLGPRYHAIHHTHTRGMARHRFLRLYRGIACRRNLIHWNVTKDFDNMFFGHTTWRITIDGACASYEKMLYILKSSVVTDDHKHEGYFLQAEIFMSYRHKSSLDLHYNDATSAWRYQKSSTNELVVQRLVLFNNK